MICMPVNNSEDGPHRHRLTNIYLIFSSKVLRRFIDRDIVE
jgi:hypothetical protein